MLRRRWAKRGARPPALHDNGFKWTYIYGFVHPYTGRSDLLRFDTVNVESFSAALTLFKTRFDPADERLLVLVVDNAGWHRSPRVVVPDGVQLVFTLPYTPELMLAEHLWLPLEGRTGQSGLADTARSDHTAGSLLRLVGAGIRARINFYQLPLAPYRLIP